MHHSLARISGTPPSQKYPPKRVVAPLADCSRPIVFRRPRSLSRARPDDLAGALVEAAQPTQFRPVSKLHVVDDPLFFARLELRLSGRHIRSPFSPQLSRGFLRARLANADRRSQRRCSAQPRCHVLEWLSIGPRLESDLIVRAISLAGSPLRIAASSMISRAKPSPEPALFVEFPHSPSAPIGDGVALPIHRGKTTRTMPSTAATACLGDGGSRLGGDGAGSARRRQPVRPIGERMVDDREAGSRPPDYISALGPHIDAGRDLGRGALRRPTRRLNSTCRPPERVRCIRVAGRRPFSPTTPRRPCPCRHRAR